jgi:hypothetical protein
VKSLRRGNEGLVWNKSSRINSGSTNVLGIDFSPILSKLIA